MAKKDVKDAFRWVVMHEMDACIFGADLEGGKWGVAALITAIYMVLTFGWTGSPGEWMIRVWVAKCYHAAFRPANERWDDAVPFRSSSPMDDQVLVEPDVGARAAQSGGTALEGIGACLGKDAVNEEKDLEEGGWETRKICWGLLYRTREGAVEMPEPKIEKAAYILAGPALDYGQQNIPWNFLEVYRGNQQYWCLVVPAMRCPVSATDAPMRGRPRRFAGPKSEGAEGALAWTDLWQATEVARVLAADRSKWSSRFAGALPGVLTLNEKLAPPGWHYRVIWVKGDAAPQRIAAIDWVNSKCAFHTITDFMQALREAVGVEEEEDAIIAIAEFMNLVTFAAKAGVEGWWTMGVIMRGGDNYNAHCWLQDRRAKNRYASFLITVVTCLEAVCGYEVASAYFRTYHNVTADASSRLEEAEARALAEAKGLEAVCLRGSWAQHLEWGWPRRALIWEGQSDADAMVAQQFAVARREPQKPRSVQLTPGQAVVLVERRGALGALCKAGARRG